MGYEEVYHRNRHIHVATDPVYYQTRARIARERYWSKIPRDARVLEFGCGLGHNIFYMRNAAGYDVSQFALDFCRKKGLTVTNNLKMLKDESFDAILSCHVLEHLENPFEALTQMHTKLKKGGKLIIVLPIETHTIPQDFSLDVNQHLYAWNFRTINNLLIMAGFKPLKNEIKRGRAYKKLLPLKNLSYSLYLSATYLTAVLFNSKEMKITAVKV